MQGYKKDFINMNCASHRGPLALIDGEPTEEDLLVAAQLTARYGQGREAEMVEVTIREKDGSERTVQVAPFKTDEIPKQWFV
jgi:hypothetical protein